MLPLLPVSSVLVPLVSPFSVWFWLFDLACSKVLEIVDGTNSKCGWFWTGVGAHNVLKPGFGSDVTDQREVAEERYVRRFGIFR
jgi:hypothetical protein